jgi:hypothetical protein
MNMAKTTSATQTQEASPFAFDVVGVVTSLLLRRQWSQ